jgi:NitT/TauT family transport system permease protein
MKRWEPYFWPIGAAAFVLALWQLAVVWIHPLVFPSPLDVLRAIEELAQKGLLWRYAGDSLIRVGTGYGIALVFAIPLGVVLGVYRTAASTANPVIQILRPISPLAWIPLAIVWFGIGNAAAIFLIFLASFFPVVVSTMNAVRNVPGIFLQAGRNFGLSPLALLGRVVFPAALPQILIGLRISLGIAWLVVVAAEMIAIDSGLGYLVIDSRNAGKRYDLVVAAMLMIGVIGLGLDTGIRCSNKLKFVSWGVSP